MSVDRGRAREIAERYKRFPAASAAGCLARAYMESQEETWRLHRDLRVERSCNERLKRRIRDGWAKYAALIKRLREALRQDLNAGGGITGRLRVVDDILAEHDKEAGDG